jgi:hypothetical protein
VTLKPDDGTDGDSIPDDRLRAVAGVDSNTDGAMTTYAICR